MMRTLKTGLLLTAMTLLLVFGGEALAGVIGWIGYAARWGMIFGGVGGDRDRRGSGLEVLLMAIVAPIAAMLLQLGISRQREYAADAAGARLVGHPYGLISALEKLGAYNNRIPMTNV